MVLGGGPGPVMENISMIISMIYSPWSSLKRFRESLLSSRDYLCSLPVSLAKRPRQSRHVGVVNGYPLPPHTHTHTPPRSHAVRRRRRRRLQYHQRILTLRRAAPTPPPPHILLIRPRPPAPRPEGLAPASRRSFNTTPQLIGGEHGNCTFETRWPMADWATW